LLHFRLFASRNVRLTPDERKRALVISQSLKVQHKIPDSLTSVTMRTNDYEPLLSSLMAPCHWGSPARAMLPSILCPILQWAEESVANGVTEKTAILQHISSAIADAGGQVDYVEVR